MIIEKLFSARKTRIKNYFRGIRLLENAEKHLRISQIGTAHWSLDYYTYNNGQAKRMLSDFVLQSFNGNPIKLAINPRVMSNANQNSANLIFQKTCYLTGNRTSSKPIPLNGCFTLRGQEAIRNISSQLFVQGKRIK